MNVCHMIKYALQVGKPKLNVSVTSALANPALPRGLQDPLGCSMDGWPHCLRVSAGCYTNVMRS